MAKYQILIAEDNPKDYQFLESLVHDWGMDVEIVRAPNGRVALTWH